MFHHWLLLSILVSILLFHVSQTNSTPINSQILNHNLDGNSDEYQRTHNAFLYAMKNIIHEPNSSERMKLLNQLRESLNRLCINGYFGLSHAESCRHVVDIIHQSYTNNNHVSDEEINDTFNEPHGIQKRFFCNGFIGCKSASG